MKSLRKKPRPRPLTKADPSMPVLIVTGPRALAIRAGTRFRGRGFANKMPLKMPELEPGADYGVYVSLRELEVLLLSSAPKSEDILGGFHFAPGGNAKARAGGDGTPAINPWSLWDINFHPACADPRGMFLLDAAPALCWIDIYKLGAGHLKNGTSKFGVTIADGNDPPQNPSGGYFANLDYATATAVMKHHGKQLLSHDEFRAAAFGVTEKTVHPGDPRVTGLDAPRTSRRGMMQATGNLWDWGHDGDPDQPRASIFGGSWLNGGSAGSRYADVDYWPENSIDHLGARGRCDHLQLD